MGAYCEESVLGDTPPPGLGWAGSEELRGKADPRKCEGGSLLSFFPWGFLTGFFITKIIPSSHLAQL